ncbi:hypothetical protein FOPG_17676, partial [Fusarium oxysporum f. sp. conglutinans race 2 54008]
VANLSFAWQDLKAVNAAGGIIVTLGKLVGGLDVKIVI